MNETAITILNLTDYVQADESRIGVLSTGETLAVALVLDIALGNAQRATVQRRERMTAAAEAARGRK